MGLSVNFEQILNDPIGRFVIAAPQEEICQFKDKLYDKFCLNAISVATKYPVSLAKVSRSLALNVAIQVSSAVEFMVDSGRADTMYDITVSGNTLKDWGYGVVMDCESIYLGMVYKAIDVWRDVPDTLGYNGGKS